MIRHFVLFRSFYIGTGGTSLSQRDKTGTAEELSC
jgi:hypothetical protein